MREERVRVTGRDSQSSRQEPFEVVPTTPGHHAVALPCVVGRGFGGGLVAAALIVLLSTSVQAADRQVLHDHVPAVVTKLNLQPAGRLPSTNRLHLAIGLPLRNQAELGKLLHDLYDPNSQQYRHYLTSKEFAERFGATIEDYQALINFAKASGLAIVETHPSRIVLDVEGAVPDIERMLHVTLRSYRHPSQARTFFAPDAEPSLDLAVPVLHISGLDNYAQHVPRIMRRPVNVAANAIPRAGTGPGNTYIGNDFRTAYVPGTTLTGSNQNIGLLQFDGYYASDIAKYTNTAKIHTSVIVTNVAVNGGISNPGTGNGEVTLDIQMSISMAPGLSKIFVYEAPGSTTWPTILSRMADDNVAAQLSCSWGDNTAGSPDSASEAIFVQMAVQGQSFFNASGDSDAFSGGVPFPSESTNVTQVGGTTLTTTSGANYSSEVVWNWGSGTGSSGGISANFAIPPWQQGISMTANHGSTTMRNVPDVALTADNVYNVSDNGSTQAVGGTSCAAPLWAGFTALANEQAASNSQGRVGFLNPALYTIGKAGGASYSNCFHDTTTGNNGTSTKYPAVSGYDLCTGWGTPTGTNLINALAGGAVAAGQLGVSPSSGLGASGNAGGPFSPASQIYTVTNSGNASFNWTVSNTQSWITLSATSGSLAVGASTNVAVSINSSANNLSAGSYSDTINFTNTTDGNGNTTRVVTLTVSAVGPSLSANGATLIAEYCTPTNGVIDPNETVTVSFSVKNNGNGSTANLVGTLQATGGVTSPTAAQNYGVVAAGGGVASQSFTFMGTGSCGGSVTATLQLQDGTNNLGSVTYTFPLGVSVSPLRQNFDSVTAPALPSGWSTSASGGQSNWVTSTTAVDTAPNAAFSPDPTSAGVSELDSPSFAISSATAQLSFRQNYDLTASSSDINLGYDGGVLEIRIGSGSYTDIVAAGGSFATGGYSRTLSSSYANPLAGRPAWSGTSGTYTTAVVNLPAAAAGQNVQLRWLCGTGNLPPAPREVVPLVSNGTLAFYGFDSSVATPDVTGSNMSASAVTVGNVSGSLAYFTGNPGKAIADTGFTLTAGPPTTSFSYFAFALTVSTGYQVSLSSLSFDDQRSGTGPTNFDVQVSQQANFSSLIYDSGVQTAHTAFATTPMNSYTLTNANLTGTIYFRIYAYKAGYSGGTWRLDNMNVQGNVTQTGSTGGTGWYIDSITVADVACCVTQLQPPVASFSGTPTTGTEPLTVTFADNSTGSITNRFWDFGDGAQLNTMTNAVSHSYTAGVYTVTLIVSGPAGSDTNTQSGDITVYTPFQAWQNQYFGSTTNMAAAANADPDGDGFSNLQEFLAGTDPTNASSGLRIVSITPQGSDLLVTWAMGSGKTNALQVTSGDGNGNYVTNGFVDLYIVTNTVGTATNYTDTGAVTNLPARYYRVRLVP